MSFLRAAVKKNIKKQENSQINKKPNQEPKEIQNPGQKFLNLAQDLRGIFRRTKGPGYEVENS